jgi:CMP-N-acetylneuraminic acid synthetase
MYEFLQEHPCDYVVMVNTTSPLLRESTLEKFLGLVKTGEHDTIVSVISEQTETFFRGTPLNFTFDRKVNSQFLEPTEKIIWSLTAWKRDVFMQLQEQGKNPVYGGRLGRFAVPKDEACDLDTLEDWNIAEGILLSRQHSPIERYLV